MCPMKMFNCVQLRNLTSSTSLSMTPTIPVSVPVYRRTRNAVPIRCFSISSKKKSSGVPLSYNVYERPSGGKVLKPPVFMTHGLLGSKQNWNAIAKVVSKETTRKVICFDARNHGDSPHVSDMSYEHMADDVLELANQLDIEKFSLLGHSMGGRSVMTFALKYPQRMDKLIVVDMSPFSMAGEFKQMRAFLEALLSMKFDPAWQLSEARKKGDENLKLVSDDPGLRAFLLTNLARGHSGPYWKPNLVKLIESLAELKKFPENLLSSTCTLPSLFIRGQKSSYIPDEDIPKIKSMFVNSRIATVEDSGHWPHVDNPTKFIPTLVGFLNES